jgi:hypothetical protein
MSVGEKLVEAAYEGIEKDLRGAKATRRALWHGILFAVIITAGLWIAIYQAVDGSRVQAAFIGGEMAMSDLPVIKSDLADIKVSMARFAGAMEILTGGRFKASTCATQEEERVANQ